MNAQAHYTTAAELALDEQFRAFVLHPSKERSDFWSAWQHAVPNDQERRRILMQEAERLVLALRPVQPDVPEGAQELVWQRIESRINALSGSTLSFSTSHISSEPIQAPQMVQAPHKARVFDLFATPGKHVRYRRAYMWAVAALLVVAVGIGIFRQSDVFAPADVLVATSDGGGRSTISLPDGSVVIVGERSELSYSTAMMRDSSVREVRVRGEAFFHVKKTARDGQAVKFRVKTDFALIEVLGTEFNVNTRNNQTAVVLQEGKVRILSPDGATELAILRPGERFEIGEAGKSSTRTVQTEAYTSWKDGKIFFDALPMSEVASILQNSHGITIRFADSSLVNMRFSGGIPSDNLPLLQDVLRETFNARVEMHHDTLTLYAR
ncbi:MAG: FecR domain-containing protein [Candidatus Kapabacteria bacterium]|jgi:ferric-dicitrate binding protein FerR (iron transport regulator)|nr:FecR domain-containing protein [Candidatus Kapabacteria bacterium]